MSKNWNWIKIKSQNKDIVIGVGDMHSSQYNISDRNNAVFIANLKGSSNIKKEIKIN